MAKQRKNNRRAPSRRRRGNQRNIVRTINRAVHFKPVRARIGADPPPIPRTLTGSVTLPVLISIGNTPQGGFTVGSVDRYSYLSLGITDKTLAATSLRASNISEALHAWMFWKDEALAETSFAIRKVCLWGPNPIAITDAVYRDAEVGLRVDLGDISNALMLHDCGTSIRRPAVAISIPYSIWMDKPDINVIHLSRCDKSTVPFGRRCCLGEVIHITRLASRTFIPIRCKICQWISATDWTICLHINHDFHYRAKRWQEVAPEEEGSHADHIIAVC